ncbi:hypothetical protein B0H14DRAFT_2605013 [Mycena olivaceomarginata]|nr:hypothetical protein B0H14DRAFT_2605013 [Mycena olivaceomarginata]
MTCEDGKALDDRRNGNNIRRGHQYMHMEQVDKQEYEGSSEIEFLTSSAANVIARDASGPARDACGSSARLGWVGLHRFVPRLAVRVAMRMHMERVRGMASTVAQIAERGAGVGRRRRKVSQMGSCCCSAQDTRMGDGAAKGGICRSHKLIVRRMGRGGYEGRRGHLWSIRGGRARGLLLASVVYTVEWRERNEAGNGNGVHSGGKRHKRLRGTDGGEARVERLCSPGKAQRGWQKAIRRWCWSMTRSRISVRSCATRAIGESGCDAAKTDAWRCDWPRWTGARGEGVSAVRCEGGGVDPSCARATRVATASAEGKGKDWGDDSPKRDQKFRSESNAHDALDSSIRSLAQCRPCHGESAKLKEPSRRSDEGWRLETRVKANGRWSRSGDGASGAWRHTVPNKRVAANPVPAERKSSRSSPLNGLSGVRIRLIGTYPSNAARENCDMMEIFLTMFQIPSHSSILTS